MSDYHNLQEENRRLAAEIVKLKAELATANMPKLTPKPAQQAALSYPSNIGQHAAQAAYIPPTRPLDQPAPATRETDVS